MSHNCEVAPGPGRSGNALRHDLAESTKRVCMRSLAHWRVRVLREAASSRFKPRSVIADALELAICAVRPQLLYKTDVCASRSGCCCRTCCSAFNEPQASRPRPTTRICYHLLRRAAPSHDRYCTYLLCAGRIVAQGRGSPERTCMQAKPRPVKSQNPVVALSERARRSAAVTWFDAGPLIMPRGVLVDSLTCSGSRWVRQVLVH